MKQTLTRWISSLCHGGGGGGCAVKTDSSHTIGVEFGSRVIDVSGKHVKLQIWDTAGQVRVWSCLIEQ